MADSDQTQEDSIDWPDEIWAEETDGHSVGIYRTSHFAAISSEYEFARYVHGKVFDSLKRYHDVMVEKLHADIAARAPTAVGDSIVPDTVANDPMADPRVKALVDACKIADTIARDLGWHRIYDATGSALRAIGGEA